MQAMWQLQEAKSKLSELIKKAKQGPQIITVHGEKEVVVLSFKEYRRIIKPRATLVDFFQQSPLAKIDLPLKRVQDSGRKVKL